MSEVLCAREELNAKCVYRMYRNATSSAIPEFDGGYYDDLPCSASATVTSTSEGVQRTVSEPNCQRVNRLIEDFLKDVVVLSQADGSRANAT